MKMRSFCWRCRKAKTTCYCESIRSFKTNVKIVLLQHPSEARMAIGTARMAHLCVENSLMIPGEEFSDNIPVARLLADTNNHCVVLFPGPDATDIAETDAHGLADRKQLVIFVIDGTWQTAQKMLKRSPNLTALPRICFIPDRVSHYRIRRQPKEYCWSTIEAVHHVLSVLDPNIQAGNLLEVFNGMVEQQIAFEQD